MALGLTGTLLLRNYKEVLQQQTYSDIIMNGFHHMIIVSTYFSLIFLHIFDQLFLTILLTYIPCSRPNICQMKHAAEIREVRRVSEEEKKTSEEANDKVEKFK